MTLLHIALILELVGEIIIAVSVVRVHTHVRKEHKLDKDVYKTIRREEYYVGLGLILLIVSFAIQMSL